MQRLLKDAQKIKRAQGETVKYSINNLDDVYEAIHVIQQEMKITGTTASEASQTISGSYHATMAAWSNIMVGMGTEQEMDEHIRGFVESGTNLVTNVAKLLPKVAKSFMEEVVPMASEWASELMGKAADAGAGLLANIYTSLTGETTTAEQVKTFFGQLGTDAMTKFNEAKATAGDFLSGFYSALTTDEGGNRQNIIAYFDELWAAVSETASGAKDAASEFLGALYTSVTGKEATAENVGATAGSMTQAASNLGENYLGAATAALNAINEVNAADMPFLEKVTEAGKVLNTAANDFREMKAHGVADFYGAITGDTEGANWAHDAITNAFQSAAEITAENLARKQDAQYAVKYDQNTLQAMMNAASSVYSNPSMYGVTESIADEWISKLASGGLGFDEYKQIADEIGAALRYAKEMEASRGEEEPEAAPVNIQVTVNVNGEEVGAIIEEQVTDGVTGRVMRQFRQAGMVTA